MSWLGGVTFENGLVLRAVLFENGLVLRAYKRFVWRLANDIVASKNRLTKFCDTILASRA